MAKIIAIGGSPGSGKSSLVKRIMEEQSVTETNFDEYPLVPYHYGNSLIVLGRYDGEGYAQGTDRMSMAVQPKAIDFLTKLKDHERTILFEGDRLFNSSFLEHCVENHETQIVVLKTSQDQRVLRYAKRGSEQNEKWLQGRESKISNILSNMSLIFNTEIFNNEDIADQDRVVRHIYEKAFGWTNR